MHTPTRTLDTVLKALADPTRVRVLGLLRGGEICVCHIYETLGIPQPKASRHLAYLRRAGLVLTSKRGLWVYYRLAPSSNDSVQAVIDSVQHCAAHFRTGQRDAAKLARKTGCCLPVAAAPSFACCDAGADAPAAR